MQFGCSELLGLLNLSEVTGSSQALNNIACFLSLKYWEDRVTSEINRQGRVLRKVLEGKETMEWG